MGSIADRFGVARPAPAPTGIAARFGASTITPTDNAPYYTRPEYQPTAPRFDNQAYQPTPQQQTRFVPPREALQRQVQRRIDQPPNLPPRIQELMVNYGNEEQSRAVAEDIDRMTMDYPEFASDIEGMVKAGRPIQVIHATIDTKRKQKIEQAAKKAEAERKKQMGPTLVQSKADVDQVLAAREGRDNPFIGELQKQVKGIEDPAAIKKIGELTSKIRTIQEVLPTVQDPQARENARTLLSGLIADRTAAQQIPEKPYLSMVAEGQQAAAQAAKRGMASYALPSTAALATGAGAMKVLAGKVAAPVALIGGLAAGAIAASGASKIQDIGLREIMGDEWVNQLAEQMAQDRADPSTRMASFMGEQIPMVLAGRSPKIGTGDVKALYAGAGRAAQKIVAGKTKALTEEETRQLFDVAFGGGTGLAMESMRQIKAGEFHPLELAASLVLNSGITGIRGQPSVGAGPRSPLELTPEFKAEMDAAAQMGRPAPPIDFLEAGAAQVQPIPTERTGAAEYVPPSRPPKAPAIKSLADIPADVAVEPIVPPPAPKQSIAARFVAPQPVAPRQPQGVASVAPTTPLATGAGVRRISTVKSWYRGKPASGTELASGDDFYSADRGVASEYAAQLGPTKIGTVKRHNQSVEPKNPLVVESKEELAAAMGLPDPDNAAFGFDFDAKAKAHAKSLGHDGIYYENGTQNFDTGNRPPELHVFKKDVPASTKVEAPPSAKKSLAKEPADQKTIDVFSEPDRLAHLEDVAREQRELAKADIATGRRPVMEESASGMGAPSGETRVVSKGFAVDGWTSAKQGQLDSAIANLKAGRPITKAQADRLREIRPYVDHVQNQSMPTPEAAVKEVKTAPETTVNESEIGDGALVRRGNEWYITKETVNGKEIADGETKPLDDFENVQTQGVLRPGELGYEKALAEYKKQEAAKPLTLESQTPEMVATERRKAEQAAEIKRRQDKRLTAKEIDTTGDLLDPEAAANPLFAVPTPKPVYLRTREDVVARAQEIGVDTSGTTKDIAKRVSIKERTLSLLDDVERQARDEIKALQSGGSLGLNKPIGIAANYTIIGAAKISTETVKFASWANEMIAEFGEAIRPHLRQIYSRAMSVANANHQTPEAFNAHVAKLSDSIKGLRPEIPEGMHERQTVTRAAPSETLNYEAGVARETGSNLAPNTPVKAYTEEGAAATVADPVKALSDIRAEPDQFKRAAKLAGYINERAKAGHPETDAFNELAATGTNAGTLLRVMRELKMGTPEGRASIHVKQFEKFAESKRATIPDEVRAEIGKRFDAAEHLPANSDEQLKATQDAVDFAVSHVPMRLTDLWDAYRYSNALSNPRAHERNIVGNLFQTFVSRPVTLATQGKPLSIPTYVKSAAESVGPAWDAFKSAFKEGGNMRSMDDIGSTGHDSPFAKSYQKKIPRVFRAIPSMLEGQDRFFSTLIQTGEADRLVRAGVAPENAARDAEELAKRYLYRDKIGDTASDESANVFSRAIDSAAVVTQSLRNAPVIGVPAKLAILFLRTPMKIAERGYDMSPLAFAAPGPRKPGGGAFNRYYGMSKDGIAHAKFKKPFDELSADNQRDVKVLLDERRGEALAGTAVMTVGTILAASGKTTWSPPKDADARREWYKSGRKPYSIQIGNRWVPMITFGPFALSLAIPAAVRDQMEENPDRIGKGYVQKIAEMAIGLTKFHASQTPLTSAANFVNTATGDVDFKDSGWSRSMGFAASQAIFASGFLRYVNQWTNPNFTHPEGFSQSIRADIPGLSKSVPPYRYPDGSPVKRQLGDILPPYSIGKDDPAAYAEFKIRKTAIEERNQHTAEADRLVEDVARGDATEADVREYVTGLGREEAARIRARLRAKDQRWRRVFPIAPRSGNGLDKLDQF